MSISYFSLLLKPSFPFDTGKVIRADTHVLSAGEHIFFRETREVYRVTEGHVRQVIAHSTHIEASESVKAHREKRAGAGAASAHISEVGRAPRQHSKALHQSRGGAVTEGFSLRIKE